MSGTRGPSVATAGENRCVSAPTASGWGRWVSSHRDARSSVRRDASVSRSATSVGRPSAVACAMSAARASSPNTRVATW